MDELYNRILETYKNGYFIYSFVVNFKSDSLYASIHPKKAHRLFEDELKRYCKRKKRYNFYCFGELSVTGKYHIHGLLFDKSTDYDEHEKSLRLFKNWLSRRFGWNGFQRIYSLFGSYKTTDVRFQGKGITTTFVGIWKYVTKDVDTYKFLPCIKIDVPLV